MRALPGTARWQIFSIGLYAKLLCVVALSCITLTVQSGDACKPERHSPYRRVDRASMRSYSAAHQQPRSTAFGCFSEQGKVITTWQMCNCHVSSWCLEFSSARDGVPQFKHWTLMYLVINSWSGHTSVPLFFRKEQGRVDW